MNGNVIQKFNTAIQKHFLTIINKNYIYEQVMIRQCMTVCLYLVVSFFKIKKAVFCSFSEEQASSSLGSERCGNEVVTWAVREVAREVVKRLIRR